MKLFQRKAIKRLKTSTQKERRARKSGKRFSVPSLSSAKKYGKRRHIG